MSLMLIFGFQTGKLYVCEHMLMIILKTNRGHFRFWWGAGLNVAVICVFSMEGECIIINIIEQ